MQGDFQSDQNSEIPSERRIGKNGTEPVPATQSEHRNREVTFELRKKHENAIDSVMSSGFACLSHVEMVNKVIYEVVKVRRKKRVFAKIKTEIKKRLNRRKIFLASSGGISCLK